MKFFNFFLAAGVAVGFGVTLMGSAIAENEQQDDELPDYQVLADYEPPVMTRIHAADGGLMAEFATNRRLYLPGDAYRESLLQGSHSRTLSE